MFDDPKVLVALVAVALGWLLSQATSIIKDWWNGKKLCKGLLAELEDINDQLERVITIHSRQLQVSALNGMEPSAALPIPNMYFKQYFKDAFPHLNRKQRISYQIIHSTLDSLNEKNRALAEFAEESYKELKLAPDDLKKKQVIISVWGDRVDALYGTAMDVRWHVGYHLQSPRSPTFDVMGPMHESYLKFQAEVDEEVKKITEGAKDLNIDMFKRTYDTVHFDRDRGVG